jgi:hypothetical protein
MSDRLHRCPTRLIFSPRTRGPPVSLVVTLPEDCQEERRQEILVWITEGADCLVADHALPGTSAVML